jgi:protein-L-isoaspartate(D-aspartate) O-methyltransferase
MSLEYFLGHGMTSQRARDRLIVQLCQQGINSEQVLDKIRFTPRHIFIDEALASRAYDNTALPIGNAQTISQPYIVARMTEILLEFNNKQSKILEIGTGCGYQTAILAQLFKQIYTVERIKTLYKQAQNNINKLGLRNIQFKYQDGNFGWSKYAPYHGIIVTASPNEIPTELLNQLAIGGNLVIPVGSILQKITRTSMEDYKIENLDYVSFVPLLKGKI